MAISIGQPITEKTAEPIQTGEQVAQAPAEQGSTDLNLMGQMGAGLDQLEGGIVSMAGAFLQNQNSPEAKYARTYQEAKARQAASVPMEDIQTFSEAFSDPLKALRVGAQVVARSLPTMAVASIPYAGPAIASASMGGEVYANQSEENKSAGKALAFGSVQAGLERVGMKSMGMVPGGKTFTAGLGKTKLGKTALAAGEATVGEGLTEGAQEIVGNIGANNSFEGATDNAYHAMVLGTLGGSTGRLASTSARYTGKSAKAALSKINTVNDSSVNGRVSGLNEEAQDAQASYVSQNHQFDEVNDVLTNPKATEEDRTMALKRRNELNDNIGVSAGYDAAAGLSEAGVALSPQSLDLTLRKGLSFASNKVGNLASLLGYGSKELRNAGVSQAASNLGISSYVGSGKDGKLATQNSLVANNRTKGKAFLAEIAGKYKDQASVVKDLIAKLQTRQREMGSTEEKSLIQDRIVALQDANNTLNEVFEAMSSERTDRSYIYDSIAERAQGVSDMLVNSGISNDFNAVRLAKTYLVASEIMLKQDPAFYEGVQNQFADASKLGGNAILSGLVSGYTDVGSLIARAHNSKARSKLKKRLQESRELTQRPTPPTSTNPTHPTEPIEPEVVVEEVTPEEVVEEVQSNLL